MEIINKYLSNNKIALMIGVFLLMIVILGFKFNSNSMGFFSRNNAKVEVNDLKEANYDSVATFASGCFWCMEATMQVMQGVGDVVSGYAGGEEENPTYEDVYKDLTGHREAVQVEFDSSIITYQELLDVFWQNIDPTDPDGQFVDRGFSYTTAVFYHDENQKQLAEESKRKLEEDELFDKPIATKLLPYTTFYRAEEYHQDFFLKSKSRYNSYSQASGRKEFKESIWQEILKEQQASDQIVDENEYTIPSESQLRESLSDIQYSVTQDDATERPFDNKYWDNKEDGIYVDIVSKVPLFSSRDKFVSGTGWPSFTKPINESSVTLHEDRKFFIKRTEVRSTLADSHLGHVFNDGPEPTGLRYCMNSASLEFISLEDMESKGYGQYLTLFE